MKLLAKTIASIAVATTATVAVSSVPATAVTLSNGPGPATVSVGVDAFGSFGSSVGSGATDAFYTPTTGGSASATTYESGVAIGFGGSRTFLTTGDIGGSGGLTTGSFTSTSPTSATSLFTFNGLQFNLTQTLTALFNTNGTRTGSQLTQQYAIANTTNAAVNFDLVRYIDGDLYFDGSLTDGGGRIGTTLFETDSATGASDPTTFVGITTSGGTIPTTGWYEIDSYWDLRSRIISGTNLDNILTGDANNDGFIDAGAGYDVTLALRNLFSLDAGATTSYTTTTVFGTGNPIPPTPSRVPEPASTFGLITLGAIGAGSLLKRKQQQKAAEKF